MYHARSWIVAKFGGTSVAAPQNWPTILEVSRGCLANGERPVLVCSALAGISDTLEELLQAADSGAPLASLIERVRQTHLAFAEALDFDGVPLVETFCRRLEDLLRDATRVPRVAASVRAEVMAVGELLSTNLAARWLRRQGMRVLLLDAREVLAADEPVAGASPDQRFLSATCSYAPDPVLQRRLAAAAEQSIVVTQGFIAGDAEGRTVLLGRGGSDTAAACIAAKLEAKRLELWSDVPGVFTGDPRILPTARLVQELSYEEAETIAGLGAKVLHPRCIGPVQAGGVPMRLRATSDPDARGTEISALGGDGMKAVIGRDRLCMLTISKRHDWRPVGFLADIAACFRKHALAMDLIATAPSRIEVTLDLTGDGTAERIPALVEDLKDFGRVRVDDDVASVSVAGQGMRGCLHRLESVLASVTDTDLHMVTQDANDLALSFVVPRTAKDALVKAMHTELFDAPEPDHAFGPCWSELDRDECEEVDITADAVLASP